MTYTYFEVLTPIKKYPYAWLTTKKLPPKTGGRKEMMRLFIFSSEDMSFAITPVIRT